MLQTRCSDRHIRDACASNDTKKMISRKRIVNKNNDNFICNYWLLLHIIRFPYAPTKKNCLKEKKSSWLLQVKLGICPCYHRFWDCMPCWCSTKNDYHLLNNNDIFYTDHVRDWTTYGALTRTFLVMPLFFPSGLFLTLALLTWQLKTFMWFMSFAQT